MNLNTLSRFVISVSILFLFSINAYSSGNIVYTQLTSLQNQPATNPVNLASLENVDGIENIGSAATKVTINVTGFYFVMIEGQAGATKSGAYGDGYVDLWMVKNNTPLPNTNSRQTVTSSSSSTIVSQSIIQLNAGDSVSIAFSASNPVYGLVSIPVTNNEPAVTSVTLTVYKL